MLLRSHVKVLSLAIVSFLCIGGLVLFFVINTRSIPSEDPLQKLLAGNARFMKGKSIHPNQTVQKRKELVSEQKPFAIIISCSDSRVPSEIIFDQGLGDIFSIRVAGNIVDSVELDSVEFAVDELKVPLILVLGHQNCGAVTAVLEGTHAVDDLKDVEPYLLPALKESKKLPGDPLENAIKTNVWFVIKSLENKPLLSKLIAKKKLQILGGYYELETGHVQILNKKNP